MGKESAVTLHCPSCGAPAAPDATRCEYCRSRLATVSCPSCFGILFGGAAYCPHCGAARSRSENPEAQPVRCPACKAEMQWVRVGSTDLLECQGCDGTWIEAAAFEHVCADRESQAAVLHQRSVEPTAVGRRTDRVRYRPCLRCGKLMNRMNFARLSGAIVDVCRGHGTFLDRGELHQVIQFILDGGLDRARQAERQELIDEQHRLRDLEGAQSRLSAASSAPAWNESSLHAFLSALFGRE